MNKKELKIFEILDSMIRQEHAITILDSIVTRVEHKLILEPEALLAWEPVLLSTYGGKLPDIVHSSWAFILKAKATTEAERHPNSHQRMISYRGSGDLQIWNVKDGAQISLLARWITKSISLSFSMLGLSLIKRSEILLKYLVSKSSTFLRSSPSISIFTFWG